MPCSIVLAVLLVTANCGFSQEGDNDLDMIRSRWKGEIEVIQDTIPAPAGFQILEAPDPKSKILKRIDRPSIITVWYSLQKGKNLF